MDEKQIVKQFEKYIRRIIMPKFPDILDFSIEHESGLVSPYVYKFKFLMDGTEQEIENEIDDELSNMVDLFGIRILKLLTFETY